MQRDIGEKKEELKMQSSAIQQIQQQEWENQFNYNEVVEGRLDQNEV